MSKNIILVAGSPGAGKTTILNGAVDTKRATIFNIGTIMLQIGQKLGYVTDRDKIRFLTPEKVNELRNKALEEIEKTEGTVIIDTHASIGENGRYMPGFPVDFLDRLGHVKCFIYIDATTTDIMARRKSDSTRKREDDGEQVIDAQRLISISALSFASTYLNVPLYVVINGQGDQQKAIAETKRMITEVIGE